MRKQHTVLGSGAKTIRELIDRKAIELTEKDFLISPDTGRSLSFQGLQKQARHVSAWLQHLGLEKGEKVAFLMDNGLFTVQLFLGTMYGGFVSVPLNVRAGASSLCFTLEHSDARAVFAESQYMPLLKEALANVRRSIQVISADTDSLATMGNTLSLNELPTDPAPEDVALLMYSSGSTGQPKAAVHSHRTILAHGQNSICSHELTSGDRSLLLLPLYHINAECVTLIPTLMSGGSVVIPHHFAVSRFWDWLDDYQCTWSAIVPTIVSQLLDWTDPRANDRASCHKRIRFLRSSSAPLSPALHREFLDKFKLLLIQAMGSTEGGNIFSNPLPPDENKLGSPGLPWGFETKIVNRENFAVPQGEPGEILIRGAALMQGYYKDPEATAAVLDPDGWFHSGDLAYQDKDGYFFVVGRSKELIIKGGMNIAPKQIDEVLESHPSVLEAAAVGVPDRYVGEDIIAFVITRSGMVGDEKELLNFCENRLGHFKTPTRIRFVKDLPKGPSGKVQRLKLLETWQSPDSGQGSSNGKPQPAGANGTPSTPTPIEQTIAGTWAELLGLPQVDTHSNFFSLGGHSLLAIQCLSRLREKLPIVLSLSDFFENATVGQQAALIRKRLRPAGSSATLEATVAWEQALLEQVGVPAAAETIPPRDRSQPCPLSSGQKRIWFFEQLVPDVPLYNESEAVRLQGKLNVEALEQALNIVISRHELLRSTIEGSNEEPVAVVHESWPLRLKRIDLSGLAPAQRQKELDRLLIEEPRRPYHLRSEPGIRAMLLQLGVEDHAFILMMHHLVCDWSSEGVIWRELSAAYRALTHGATPNLPPLLIQHGDYAAWQVRQTIEGAFAEDLDFWEETLRGAPPLLELPTDRPRPSVNSYRGARQRFEIGSKLAQALRDCSRREQISLFTLFTAALDVLLYRYTGQDHILLGIPLADRDRPELQSVVGFLLHTHVLRMHLSGDITFRELLTRVQRGVLDLYAHRAAPFDQVVNRIHPERNLSHSPLFQVMINWRDRDQQLSFIGMEGMLVESLLAESGTSKFDLTVMLTDDQDEISLEVEYSTDLFDDVRIMRMAGHYQTLLEGIVTDPDRKLSELPILTNSERHQLLVEWNQTQRDYPRNKCVHELFEEQVERMPEAVAVVFENEQLTYRELNMRANQLAHHLRKLSVGPDTLVGICLERSLEMVVGLLGVLKAGGAYVPLDPQYPNERLAFMLQDSKASVLLTQRQFVERLGQAGLPIICLDSDCELFASESQENLHGSVGPENLIYVIYTSGSTGIPKGAGVYHHSFMNLMHWFLKEFTFGVSDKVLVVSSPSFDLTQKNFYATLMCGGELHLLPTGPYDPGLIAQLIEQNQVTLLNCTPSAFYPLIEPPARRTFRRVASLRCVFLGGEPISLSRLRPWLEAEGCHCEVANTYGPTECTDISAFYRLNRSNLDTYDFVPTGKPIHNVQLVVVNEDLQLCPIGVAGELCVAGVGVGAGYFNNSELTASRFIANPFSEISGQRLYRTGDLVRYLSDGDIEYLGRVDHQVKIRGFRVELGEIEAQLNGHPLVREAVALAREDTPGEKRLVAYVTARNAQAPKAAELRERLRAKLPEYMVPSAFVALEKFPLTPNGKVDRKALPRPDFQAPADKFVPPSTPTEIALVNIFCEVLGIKQLGIHDNFFEIGGNSLLALRIQARIEKELGKTAPLSAFLQIPTVAALQKRLAGPRESVQLIHDLSPHPMVNSLGLFVFHFNFMARSLAKYLGQNRRVFAVTSRITQEYNSWQLTGQIKTSLEGLARDCLKDMQLVQPHGPYCLAGFCFGGNLASAVADQLIQKGEDVALLALVSSYNHAGMKPRPNPWLGSWPYHIRQISKHGSAYLSVKLRQRHNIRKLHRPQPGLEVPNGSGMWELEENRALQSDFARQMLRSYNARPYPVKTVLFRAVKDAFPLKWKYDATYGWKDLIVGDMLLEDILCGHSEIVQEPHIANVARKLNVYLSEVGSDVLSYVNGTQFNSMEQLETAPK